MPEWYFVLLSLGILIALGASWRPLLWLEPVLIVAVSITLLQAARGSYHASFNPQPRSKLRVAAMRLVVASLHLVQPAARLLGRVQHGMGPWNWNGFIRILPRSTVTSIWSSSWEPIESRLSQLNLILRESGIQVVTGSDFDSWDLSIPGGMFGTVRVLAMLEEHANGQQLCRFRAWPKAPLAAVVMLFALTAVAGCAIADHAAVAGSALLFIGGTLGFLIHSDCAFAMDHWRDAVDCYLRDNDNLRMLSPDRIRAWSFRVRGTSR
jgi:hypothetical protein